MTIKRTTSKKRYEFTRTSTVLKLILISSLRLSKLGRGIYIRFSSRRLPQKVKPTSGEENETEKLQVTFGWPQMTFIIASNAKQQEIVSMK